MRLSKLSVWSWISEEVPAQFASHMRAVVTLDHVVKVRCVVSVAGRVSQLGELIRCEEVDQQEGCELASVAGSAEDEVVEAKVGSQVVPESLDVGK